MSRVELDFELLIHSAITHTKTCVADHSVKKEDAVLGLHTIVKDLSARGAPADALEKLKAYRESLAQRRSLDASVLQPSLLSGQSMGNR